MITSNQTSILNHTLKEWAVAIDALIRGETIMLLRKGGIHDRQGRFSVEFDRVLLYPTYEHQQPHLLKPHYAPRMTAVPVGEESQGISISAWAKITHVWQVREPEIVASLMPYHIWTDHFVSERLRWKPHQPLYIVLLRVYRLAETQSIPHRPEYGGCRSWINLAESIEVTAQFPVINDDDYIQQVNELQEIVIGQKKALGL